MKLKSIMKKKFILFLVCFLVGIFSAYILIYEYHYKIIWEHDAKRKEEIEKIEMSYKKKQNISDAYDLLEHYLSEEKYDKAFIYGKACLDIGANYSKLGGRINFFLARICYEMKKLDLARKYLRTAISLANEDVLEKYETVKKYGMDDLLSFDEWNKILKRE